MSVETFFLPVAGGQRFCIFHPAETPTPRGLVLYVHPFAEEMNKSRRMAALQSRAMARTGYAVLQIDLLGCGDSSGDFGNAGWQAWVDDVVQASVWLRTRGHARGATRDNAPLWLWGLRAGCLLCIQAASYIDEPCHFLFWQPPLSGKLLLQQFLRLKVAADMLDGRALKSMDGLRNTLKSGEPVEIAGYTLAAELSQGLEAALLSPPVRTGGMLRVEWLEVSGLEPPRLNTFPVDAVDAWRRAGYQLVRHVTPGPAFWQSGEMRDVPELITATTAVLTPQDGP
jgi:exosortase A-associated hydrolase 2